MKDEARASGRGSKVALHCIAILCLCTFYSCKGEEGQTVLLPDRNPPVTTAHPAGGSYNAVQYVKLESNEAATIYYSTDGADPAPGAVSTVSGMTPLFWVRIGGGTTVLKYFAIDGDGNREAVKNDVYVITLPLQASSAVDVPAQPDRE